MGASSSDGDSYNNEFKSVVINLKPASELKQHALNAEKCLIDNKTKYIENEILSNIQIYADDGKLNMSYLFHFNENVSIVKNIINNIKQRLVPLGYDVIQQIIHRDKGTVVNIDDMHVPVDIYIKISWE